VTAVSRSASSALRLVAFGLGAVATLPVLAGGELVAALALAATDLHEGVAAAFVNAAIPEETAKLATLALLLLPSVRGLRVALPVDAADLGVRRGLEAGFSLGLGFALVETLLQVGRLAALLDTERTLTVTLVRALTALPLHACVGALAGGYLATRSYGKAWVVPTALHGLYDLAVFEAARGAGIGTLALAYVVLALVVWWVVTLYAWSATAGAAQAASRLSPL
jgi:RsiW-degrading membrane proteinase PrsW (M82 family)